MRRFIQRNHETFSGKLIPVLASVLICFSAQSLIAAKTKPERAVAPSSLVWPAPPDQPRVAYVRSIESDVGLGVKRSAVGKFGRWLTGATPENGQFIKPFGICFDEKDNLCFTDTGANAVYFFDRNRKKLHRWEQIGTNRFISPVSIAKRGEKIFVADSELGRVVIFNDEGKLLAEITDGLERPSGLIIVSNRLFVVDSKAQAVFSFDLQGRPLGKFGERGTGAGEFNFPTHINTDAAGNLFITDSVNGRIQIFDFQGRFLRQIGNLGDVPGSFSRPKGVAVDRQDHAWIIDANFDNIQLFDDQGHLLMALGDSGNQPGQFWLPNGIAINSANEIFVTDTYNRRIQVFKFIGQP